LRRTGSGSEPPGVRDCGVPVKSGDWGRKGGTRRGGKDDGGGRQGCESRCIEGSSSSIRGGKCASRRGGQEKGEKKYRDWSIESSVTDGEDGRRIRQRKGGTHTHRRVVARGGSGREAGKGIYSSCQGSSKFILGLGERYANEKGHEEVQKGRVSQKRG